MSYFTPVDPQEYLYDDEERWIQLGTESDAVVSLSSEEELEQARCSCRRLALCNEFAINGHENRISYVIGTGHVYTVKPRFDTGVSTDLIKRAQDVLDSFIENAQWYQRQQEILRRKDRDGEAFLRYFPNEKGEMQIRFIEPDYVRCPKNRSGDASAAFGVQVIPEDVESVQGFWVDNSWIPADEVQHRKANVDFNARRGIPLFFPVRKNLRRAEKILRNMSVVAEIQSAIAIIRKHGGSTRSSVEQFVSRNADYTAQGGMPAYGGVRKADALNGVHGDAGLYYTGSGAVRFSRYAPGTILDTSAGVDYQFPVSGINAASYVTVLQAELRAIASRLVMPEFMLTCDASNANYSSTMIAEGPAVRMFQRLQQEMIRDDSQLMYKVLNAAVMGGRLPEETIHQVFIKITPPSLSVRDRLKDVQADKILTELGVLDVDQLRAHYGAV